MSAAAGVPLLLLAVWHGGWAHFVLTVLIMLLAVIEWSKLFVRMNSKPPLAAMMAGVLALASSAHLGGAGAFGAAVTPVVLMMLLIGVFRHPCVTPGDVAAALAGTLYVGLLVYFYLIRTLDGGGLWILFLLACTWTGDTMAYLVGKKLGRIKLAPLLSPGKTLEGALGGLVGSVTAAVVVYAFNPVLPLSLTVLLGLIIGISGLLGDLFESSLKRTAGIKDAGGVIPGHGGVLDRFDSLLFAAPAAYYSILAFGG